MTAPQRAIRAVYMRGGTSRALIFHREDLPILTEEGDFTPWNAVFTAALGSPDPDMRQLDGMGGGISSLSKIAVVGPPTHPDADIDFTFAQVGIDRATVGYKGNCGNISSVIGPYAVDEGLVNASGQKALVRIHNTNTGKIINASFPVTNGKAEVRGDCRIDGVAGTGAPIRLDFVDPAGAATGALFPTGKLTQTFDPDGGGPLEATMIDLANPLIIISAAGLQVDGEISPDALAADTTLMARLVRARQHAAILMGLAADEKAVHESVPNLPLVAIVSAGQNGAALTVRMISADQPHKATPLTGALALAVAARIRGTVAEQAALQDLSGEGIRVAHPTGQIELTTEVEDRGVESIVRSAGMMRTARRLMAGEVYIPT